MLSGSFFYTSEVQHTDGAISAALEINAAHNIFEGHFPGQPVVPGVCMMQMVKEIVEQVFKKSFSLVKADEMKFLAIIDPVTNNAVQAFINYKLDENKRVAVTASIKNGDLVHFKFKGLFTEK